MRGGVKHLPVTASPLPDIFLRTTATSASANSTPPDKNEPPPNDDDLSEPLTLSLPPPRSVAPEETQQQHLRQRAANIAATNPYLVTIEPSVSSPRDILLLLNNNHNDADGGAGDDGDDDDDDGADAVEISMFKHPLITLYYFWLAMVVYANRLLRLAVKYILFFLVTLPVTAILYLIVRHNSQASYYTAIVVHAIQHVVWWTGLGILSSVGLGTGLHTFVLYLGPYIAHTTLAASACNSLDFDDDFKCNTSINNNNHSSNNNDHQNETITITQIFRRVWLSCFLWGVGTAIGELPPYFVARAARRINTTTTTTAATTNSNNNSGNNPMFEQQRTMASNSATLYARVKAWLENSVATALQRYGFWSIVLFASIPNPLFDMAGLLCGHGGVSLATFFGATLIGKAFIKVALQSLFVIAIFTERHLATIIDVFEHVVPMSFLRESLDAYKRKFAHKDNAGEQQQQQQALSWFVVIWRFVLVSIVLMFIISIIESTAQHYVRSRRRGI